MSYSREKTVIEKSHLSTGNGGVTLGVERIVTTVSSYNDDSPATKHVNYRLVQSLSHYDADLETNIKVLDSTMVVELIRQLTAVLADMVDADYRDPGYFSSTLTPIVREGQEVDQLGNDIVITDDCDCGVDTPDYDRADDIYDNADSDMECCGQGCCDLPVDDVSDPDDTNYGETSEEYEEDWLRSDEDLTHFDTRLHADGTEYDILIHNETLQAYVECKDISGTYWVPVQACTCE